MQHLSLVRKQRRRNKASFGSAFPAASASPRRENGRLLSVALARTPELFVAPLFVRSGGVELAKLHGYLCWSWTAETKGLCRSCMFWPRIASTKRKRSRAFLFRCGCRWYPPRPQLARKKLGMLVLENVASTKFYSKRSHIWRVGSDEKITIGLLLVYFSG
jgi:hypothetical protein